MLTTPHKRFVYARSERFTDFSEFSFFRALLMRRPRSTRIFREEQQQRTSSGRWKPAAWTPWLWMK